MNDPSSLTEEDVRALRSDGDLLRLLKQQMAAGRARNKARRALVLRYPDLAERLTEPPISHSTPGHWTGYLAPETWMGAPNPSPVRAALAALIAEAEQRASAERSEAA